MIELINLNKTFFNKHKEKNEVLKDINLKLPNKGFAFILGKSGSGKTTLLSLIGGLIETTSGNIIVDNIDVTKLDNKSLDNYRNEVTGYIFQDYQLIDNLTVYENIKMMLDFKRDNNLSKIDEALNEVGLKGYESRYPKELSGGEKQRVAIARILVKNPRIILADEPTGNLDPKTSKQILSILKKISKERLVLIVSHNIYESNEFADYLIYLADGKINGTFIRNKESENGLRLVNKTLYIPLHKTINETDKNDIIEKLKNNEINSIIQKNNEFLKVNFDFKTENTLKINKKLHIKESTNLKYGFKFLKGTRVKSFVFSLFISIILSFIGLCVLITATDSYHEYERYYKTHPQDSIVLVKKDDNLKASYGSHIYGGTIDKDYEKLLRESGYQDKVYESRYIYARNDPRQDLYGDTNKGLVAIVECDEDYLVKLFGKNDELTFVSSNPIQNERGIYVTDFYASYRLRVNGYNPLDFNKFYSLQFKAAHYVKGIIDTHYKEKYPEIYEYYIMHPNQEKVLEFFEDPRYKDFYYEFNNIYTNAYSLDEGAFIDCFSNPDIYTYNPRKIVLTKDNSKTRASGQIIKERNIGLENFLKDDEILLSKNNYYALTGETINLDPTEPYKLLEPIEVEFNNYDLKDDKLEHSLFNKKLKVVGCLNRFVGILMNDNLFIDIIKANDLIFSLHFYDTKNIDAIINFAKKLDLEIAGNVSYETKISSRYINTLDGFFIFVMCVLLIVALILLYYYNYKIVQNKMFEIGVMKSLGSRDIDLIKMLSLQMIRTTLETLILYNILQAFVTRITDKILFISINNVAIDAPTFTRGISFIFLDPYFVLIANLIIVSLFILFYLIPFIKIRLLKPSEIVKAKE